MRLEFGLVRLRTAGRTVRENFINKYIVRRIYSPQERCRIFDACCSIEIPLEERSGSARLSFSDKVKCLGGLGRELVAGGDG